MDSMVFLDDNPFERNLVRSLIPEIIVPELPEDPALYLGYLQSLNLFETATYTEEDLSSHGPVSRRGGARRGAEPAGFL